MIKRQLMAKDCLWSLYSYSWVV